MKAIAHTIKNFTFTNLRNWLLIAVFFAAGQIDAQVTSSQDGNYSVNSTWIGPAPDAQLDNVLILHNVNLNVSIVVKKTFDIQGSLSGTSGMNIILDDIADLTAGDLNIDGNLTMKQNSNLTVKSGDTVYVQDFEARNTSTILVESGGVLVVSNDFEMKNTSSMVLNGEVCVGNETTIANTATITGTGVFKTGPIVNINNSATIFGSTVECNDCIYSNGCTMSSISTDWTGSSNTTWLNNANWSSGVPDDVTPAKILASATNMPIISGVGAECFHLTIEPGASLEISGTNILDIYGNVDMQGSFIANQSTVQFVGACWSPRLTGSSINFYSLLINNTKDVAIASGSWGIEGVMTVTGGSFETNDSLTIVSNALGTGQIGEITGVAITGEIVMERYIDAGATNWRYFSSAVAGATLDQYNDDFVTAGYPGSWYPIFGWTSIYTYDETMGPGLGYLPATSSSQVIGVGQGLQVWCGDTVSGTSPFVVDLRGVPNQGTILMPVSYTFTGTPGEDGFCNVGNPYPSTIDWDAAGWIKTNMANATYIRDPDTQLYATYIAGAGANGGSRYIASQQSFWVEATAAGPILAIVESCKATNDPAFFKAGEASNPGSNIKLSGFDMSDECVIRNVEGSVDAKEDAWDARKLWGAWGVNPQISLINGEALDLTVHTFDFGYEEWQVPLRAIVFQTGTYNLDFVNIGELDIPCLKLEDTYSGIYYDIEEGTSLPFEMYDTTWAPRFILHFGKKYEQNVTDNLCPGDANGEFEIELNEASVFYNLISGTDTTSLTASADPLVIPDLAAANYMLDIPDLINFCGSNTFQFSVGQPSIMNVFEEIVPWSGTDDASIAVTVLGGTPPYSYLWSTGDNWPMISNLMPGEYSLTVTDDNGCVVNETFEIVSVLELENSAEPQTEFYFNAVDDQIVINNLTADDNQIVQLYSVSGIVLHSYELESGQSSHILQVPTGLAKGMYIAACGSESFKFIR
ncbi:SprB repeat-containing protein [Crocinitomix catalasitica]|nr:SprB repeat-containing protein [Crocinitomix catalasitica]